MEHVIEVVDGLEAQCSCGGWTYTQVDASLPDREAEELMQKSFRKHLTLQRGQRGPARQAEEAALREFKIGTPCLEIRLDGSSSNLIHPMTDPDTRENSNHGCKEMQEITDSHGRKSEM